MARPRKPSKVLEISGAYKTHPERRRTNEPLPTGEIGEPPFDDERLSAAWREVVSIAPPGVLTDADRVHLEIICHLLVEFRECPQDFTANKLTRLESMLGKFGMNPSDRTRISGLGKEKGANDFAAL